MLRKTLILTLLIALLNACAPQTAPTTAPAEQSMTYTDSLGRTVTLETIPQRIVSLAPSNTEILFAVAPRYGWGTEA